MASNLLPSLPDRREWSEFLLSFDWKQGEHVGVIAPTGWGKSTLNQQIMQKRDWCVVCCTKKTDDTYNQFMRKGYVRHEKWPPPKSKTGEWHILLWPKYKTLNSVATIGGPLFRKMLEQVYIDENWTVNLDDLFYLSMKLKLRTEIEAINYQVRSMGVSLVAAMQRPKKVPLESWDQATHLFIGGINNYDDLMMLRGVVGVDMKTLLVWLGALHHREWLYVSTISKQLAIVKPDPTYILPRRRNAA